MTTPDPHTRAAQLARLPSFGFVPPDGATPDGGAAGAFAAAVNNFAVTFWELPPAERRACWTALRAQAHGPAAARLAELEPGLDVTPARQSNPEAAELGRAVRELFTLPARTRAERRRHWQTTAAIHFMLWVRAAKELAADRPTAALDPLLLDRLRNALVPTAVAADPAGGGGPLDGTPWLASRDARERRDTRRKRTDLVIVVVAVLVIGVVGGVVFPALKNSPKPLRPVSPPTPTPTISASQIEDMIKASRTTSTTFRALSGWKSVPGAARPTRR